MSRGVRLVDLPADMRQAARDQKRLAAEAEREQFRRYCQAAGLPVPVPEYRFHGQRRWRIDYAFVAERVALEVEGASWGTGPACHACGQRRAGAHTRGGHFRSDIAKYNALAGMGWRLVRTTPEDLYAPDLISTLRAAIRHHPEVEP